MTFEEWYEWLPSVAMPEKVFAKFVWQAATEQSQARLEKLGLELLEQHAKTLLAETRVAELEAEVAVLREALIHHQKLTRPIDKTMEALTATSDAWIKRHDVETIANFLEQSGKWMTNAAMLAKRDAGVLRNAATYLSYEPIAWNELRRMAAELEGGEK